jgi:hypothetical protein
LGVGGIGGIGNNIGNVMYLRRKRARQTAKAATEDEGFCALHGRGAAAGRGLADEMPFFIGWETDAHNSGADREPFWAQAAE